MRSHLLMTPTCTWIIQKHKQEKKSNSSNENDATGAPATPYWLSFVANGIVVSKIDAFVFHVLCFIRTTSWSNMLIMIHSPLWFQIFVYWEFPRHCQVALKAKLVWSCNLWEHIEKVIIYTYLRWAGRSSRKANLFNILLPVIVWLQINDCL